MSDVAWIAADWGTSNLRVWGLDASGKVIETARSDQGMGKLTPDQYEAVLNGLVAGWADGRTDVLICGMAGAKQGWTEAPYLSVPCAPAGADAISVQTSGALKVRILPGLCQMDPPDVMRGEETQIAGFLATRPDFAGTICLPGTHSKWVQIAGGQVTSFRTKMTGELFNLLSEQSVLRHGMAGDWDDVAFTDGLKQSHDALNALFTVRSTGLLNPSKAAGARSYLSGLLIGAELQGIDTAVPVVLIGDGKLSALYATALEHFGATSEIVDGEGLVLEGLKAAYAELKG